MIHTTYKVLHQNDAIWLNLKNFEINKKLYPMVGDFYGGFSYWTTLLVFHLKESIFTNTTILSYINILSIAQEVYNKYFFIKLFLFLNIFFLKEKKKN